MSQIHHEDTFQREISEYLAVHGWLASANSAGYDKERALFPEDLLRWLADTDPENYGRIVPACGDAAAREKGENRVLDRVAKTLALSEDQGGGTLSVLRNGVTVPAARRFRLMQPPVSTNLNPDATQRYAQNRLRVVREVVYSTRHSNRIDLVLFLNGIPIATIETKTTFSQSLEEVKKQYRKDRNPAGEPLLTPFRGALVHFGLTDENIVMTTALQGEDTFFLPFDRGHDNGAGNAPIPGKHRTSYFWEEILERDTWLNLISKFIYVNHENRTDPLTGKVETRRQIRFPRYHQWRAVTRLTEAARTEGPGHKYLIQHSAGSGKTDSIAWTAHRLADLQTADGNKVFDSVIVISDRQVLDRQLQDAVDQLTNASGKFQPIVSGSEGSKTAQLLEAFAAGVPIVGLTLQTFPHALQKMREEGGALSGKRFAVIADEAHSSQSGAAANALKELLYNNEEAAGDGLDDGGADQDALNAMAARVDEDKRISYFAFTATPKAKTLEVFGRRPSDGEDPKPFDLYSMKQAIEEEFILDVLKNYTSYAVAARIARRSDSGGEEIDVRRSTRAIIGTVELHPTNVASKVHEIIEHFTRVVQPELGGRAKAMVVTSSRAAAVRYHRAFQRAVADRNLNLKSLVAFSGEVDDPDVEPITGGDAPQVTEASENPELLGRDLADVFRQRDQHVLIVANKYQTGFDEPLLVGMYVDKKLSGISAVQTLSRLNRQAKGKDKTFIVDFIEENSARVEAAFQEYYEDASLVQESDPDLVADLMIKLENERIFTRAEVDRFWEAWRDPKGQKTAHGQINSIIDPAVDRYQQRWRQAVETFQSTEDNSELETLKEFRQTLGQYAKTYDFFSQILHYGDEFYEKLAAYAEKLQRKLTVFTEDDTDPDWVDLDDIVLTHYKLEKIRQEDLSAAGGGEGLRGVTEAGIARANRDDRGSWDEILEKVNKYFGTLEISDDDKLSFAESLIAKAAEDERLKHQAQSNTRQDFGHSPTLRVVAEDALWSHEDNTSQLIRTLRSMSSADQAQFFMDMGLYERLAS